MLDGQSYTCVHRKYKIYDHLSEDATFVSAVLKIQVIREAPTKKYSSSYGHGHCPFGGEGGSKPLPGWFVAPIFRRNVHVQTGICMILPENRCHRVPV